MSRRSRGFIGLAVGACIGFLVALPATIFCFNYAAVALFLGCGVLGALVGRRMAKRIKADLSKQAPNNSYAPPLYYEDKKFTCMDCGKVEVWTAEQQQWWYETAKGPIYSTAVRCRACRQSRKETWPND